MLVSASIRGPLDIHHADDTKRRQHTTGANDPIPETCLIFAYYAHSKSTVCARALYMVRGSGGLGVFRRVWFVLCANSNEAVRILKYIALSVVTKSV